MKRCCHLSKNSVTLVSVICSGYQELKSCEKYGVLIPDEMINQDIKDYKAYKTYLGFATREVSPKKARKFKKIASPTKKLSPVLEEEPVKKPKRAKKPTKKSTNMPTTGVVIRDTLGVSVSKKKAPAKVDRGKGMYLLSDVALLEVAQLKKVLKKSKQDTHMLHASGSSEGADLESEVPDESKDSKDDDDNNDDSDDNDDDSKSNADDDNDASDSERTDSDDDENLTLNLKDNEEEVYVHTLENYEFTDDEEEYEELYKDVNVRLKYPVHEEEGKGNAEMTDASCDDATQEKSYEQVVDDAHVTLIAAQVTQKTEGPMQSSSVLFDFANQFLNLDNVPPVDKEVVSMMNVKVLYEEPSTQTVSLLTIPVTVIPETSTTAAPAIPLIIPPITPLPQQSTPTPAPTTV
ncbi:hypothetical protein Tco_0736980 [Tanacetum coccineum]